MIDPTTDALSVYTPLVRDGQEGIGRAQGVRQPASESQAVNGDSRSSEERNFGVKIELSDEARKLFGEEKQEKVDQTGKEELTDEEQSEVQELKERDNEVRAHERAHVMAGGNLVRGGASFQYQTGPDGKQYAIGGEVSIDTSPVEGDPDATIQKANQIRRAALAPIDPSGQDRAVAAQADAMSREAQTEKLTEIQEASTQQGTGASTAETTGGQGTGASMPDTNTDQMNNTTNRVRFEANYMGGGNEFNLLGKMGLQI